MNNVVGNGLNQMMLAMSLVDSPYSELPITSVQHSFFAFLEANNVDITKSIMKYLDTAHSIVSDREVSGSRVQFFENITPLENEHFVIFAIRVLTGVNANIKETNWVPGTDDPNVINGEFEISSNGTNVMKNKPFSDFTRAEEQPYSGWVELPSPIIWQAQTSFNLTAIFPDIVPVADTNLRMELFGMKLIG